MERVPPITGEFKQRDSCCRQWRQRSYDDQYFGNGGTKDGGSHFGVNMATSLVANLNNTNATSALSFKNCIGGNGGNTNHGVNFGAGFTQVNGSLNFLNVVGGGTSASVNNFGVNISGVTVTAPVITGRDLAGGPGMGGNYGLNVGNIGAASQLGSAITNVLTISANSLGSGTGEYGINIFGSSTSTSTVMVEAALRWP